MADSNPPEQFKDMAEIAEYAKTMADIDEIITFVEAENLKLNRPWDKEDLNQLLNKISTHIRKTQPDLLYKQCLEEMKKLVPDDDEDNRPEQVKNFIKCSNFLGLNEDEALEIILKTCKKFKLNTEWKSVITKLYKRLKSEATNKNSKSIAEGEEDNTQHKLPSLEERLKEYPEEIIKKANEILDTGDPFLYICDTWNENHVGDRNLGEILACSVASTQVLNSGVGLHEKPSGDVESGKSSACTKMGKLCPAWKFRATTFSPKVLYYMKDLLPGTIIYTDDVDLGKPDVISTIKKVTGEFEDPTVSDTIIDGKAVALAIPPRINFWMSSVDTIGDKQLGTRFIYSNTEGGAEHDREVNHKQIGKALGKPPEDDNEKILVCRCVFEYICDQLHYVFSSYLFASTWSAESEKRNLEKFASILFSITVFNYRQRETLHDCLVGTLKDWERAITVYSPVAKNNSCLLSDEEISVLYSIYEMSEAYDNGVPHKRLLNYMKEKGKFSKSDSTLKRILIGDIGSGKQGFKEKVPGFSYETVSKPKLDDKGLEIKGSGYTKTLCYSYDGALFDGIPKDADIVENIKKGTFVLCDYYAAKGVKQLFREDRQKAHNLKKNIFTFENWKESLRNQTPTSEIVRNHQNSKPLISELSRQKITNNNNNNIYNKLKNQENNNIGVHDISVCVSEGRIDEEIHTKLIEAFSPENMNSVNSESSASDHALNSELFSMNSMNSEPAACDNVLNPETCKMSHESPASDHVLNSETCDMNSVNSVPSATETPGVSGAGDTKSLEVISSKIQEYLNKECHGNSVTKLLDTHINDFRKSNPEFQKESRQHLEYAFEKVLKTVPPLDESQQKEHTPEKPAAEKKGIVILKKALQAGKVEATL